MKQGDLKSIAQASEALGVTQRTLRFYEDKGLIQPKRVGSMRVYSRREMGRMQLILRGKRLGFSIREIGEFLSLYDHDPDQVVQAKLMLEATQERLAELRHQREAIEQTITELETIEAMSRQHLAKRDG
ncbi:MerR family transcriptional regulator [Erythrobacter sp. GH3-10]|uniref:MerR family transcriptional regulator n=2 Tax=Aurantiacibacter rhizosphaerae TaxID=2691582 RepID=A0A844XFE1_9SPHN|nr:MerR family DNA-binding transcriptional regulator [Aurantiacibacter rhizosphaerae]MWV28314.1 MerR family transcriptional regulator [Aurantiacibacter rhizosphaerae]